MVNMDVLEHRWLTRIAATALGGPFHDRRALHIMTFPLGTHSPGPLFSSESVDNGETPSFKWTMACKTRGITSLFLAPPTGKRQLTRIYFSNSQWVACQKLFNSNKLMTS